MKQRTFTSRLTVLKYVFRCMIIFLTKANEVDLHLQRRSSFYFHLNCKLLLQPFVFSNVYKNHFSFMCLGPFCGVS